MSEPVHVMVVCTGNICRSPMAEAMIRRYAGERQRPMEVCSASVMGLKDQPAHKNAIKVMSEIGIDLTPHRAQPVTRELMEWADYVLTMEIQHMKKLRKRYPEHENKLTLMGSFGGYMEINDPLGFWKGPFKICRAELLKCTENFVDTLPVD